ncbi:MULTISPECIES: polysaccharide deacetylase family protein [Bacillus]|uniref:polysaccharide deacetylase family protein n=1 Tax=Bacillus TaxID=1386 RepID=UPI0011A0F630|nr:MULTISPECIES: polysaccharide deacetylase family protein [Bacillus]MDI0274730.1 polysaccharide deacetylase family protein [Bacillus safensis]QRF33208.1 polysaccharide deacetylase [Bacillus safensis]QRY39211.1 polysaccharide deacetylase [Bacillus sp. PDNC022]WCL56702.1 polysaccharide deacetylase [Bacillus safensis]
MQRVKKKQAPSNTMLLSKAIGFVILTLILFFIWDMSKTNMQAADQPAKLSASSQFRDTSTSMKAKDDSRKTLDAHFKINSNKHVTDQTIFLTFDDGPSATTNQLLDVLKAHQVKATFFMLGPQIKEHPAAVKRLHQEGHQLGLHGITHDVKRFYQKSDSPVNEMKEDQRILASVTGEYTHLVRTPYGSAPNLTDQQKARLKQKGFVYWDWTIDSLDWKYKSSKYVPEVLNQLQVLETKYPKEPKIILMHDQPATAKYLNSLITQLKAKGYTFEVLDETMKPLQQ